MTYRFYYIKYFTKLIRAVVHDDTSLFKGKESAPFIYIEPVVESLLARVGESTVYKIENEKGKLVGYFVLKPEKAVDFIAVLELYKNQEIYGEIAEQISTFVETLLKPL